MLDDFLRELKVPVKYKFEIRKVSHMKVGGIAEQVVFPQDAKQLAEILSYLNDNNLDYLVVGNWSNTIFRSGKIKTILINLKNMNSVLVQGQKVFAEAGALVPSISRLCAQRGLRGFSGLYGVPATLGGALFMNASCYGSEISEYLSEVTVLDRNGKIEKLNKSELEFSWRSSSFQKFKDKVIISASFSLPASTPEIELQQIKNVELHRKKFQEHSLPNLGSVFATKDIYTDIASKNRNYGALMYMVKVFVRFFPGPRDQLFARLMVSLTKKFFYQKSGYPNMFSDKSINCIVNRGSSSEQLIAFIRDMKKKMHIKSDIEVIIFEDLK